VARTKRAKRDSTVSAVKRASRNCGDGHLRNAACSEKVGWGNIHRETCSGAEGFCDTAEKPPDATNRCRRWYLDPLKPGIIAASVTANLRPATAGGIVPPPMKARVKAQGDEPLSAA
jgi:hypothetical protein